MYGRRGEERRDGESRGEDGRGRERRGEEHFLIDTECNIFQYALLVLHVAKGDEGQQQLVTSGLVYVSTHSKMAQGESCYFEL